MSNKILFEATPAGKVLGIFAGTTSAVAQSYLLFRLKKSITNMQKENTSAFPTLFKVVVFNAIVSRIIYAFASAAMNAAFVAGAAFDFRFCWIRVLTFFGNKGSLYFFFVERVNTTLKFVCAKPIDDILPSLAEIRFTKSHHVFYGQLGLVLFSGMPTVLSWVLQAHMGQQRVYIRDCGLFRRLLAILCFLLFQL